jgi:hypothetical protein
VVVGVVWRSLCLCQQLRRRRRDDDGSGSGGGNDNNNESEIVVAVDVKIKSLWERQWQCTHLTPNLVAWSMLSRKGKNASDDSDTPVSCAHHDAFSSAVSMSGACRCE